MKNPLLWGLAAGVLAVVVGVLGYGLSYPGATLLGPAVSRGSVSGREVCLTFDDGPSEYTGQVLDVLKRYNVRATFFVCGASAERHPDLVRRMVAEGHEIGNHTYSHPYLVMKSRDAIAGEIDRTQDMLERISGRRPTLFRPPFGVRWFTLPGVLAKRGLRMVLWSIRPYDGRLDADGIVKLTLKQLAPGAVIVLHDGFEARPDVEINRAATVTALPRLIAAVRKAGYTFGAVPLQ